MNHEQTPKPNSAQNEAKISKNIDNLSIGRGLETATRLTAITLLGVTAVAGGLAIDANNKSESYRIAAPIQEQQGIPHGAEYANEYANAKEQERNQLLGVTAYTLAAGLGGLTLAGHNKRTREITISGEKPTEQPKE